MLIQHNIPLRKKNTFGINCSAEYFIDIVSSEDLEEAALLPYDKRILGGGSNILLSRPIVRGLVMGNKLSGRNIVAEDEDSVWIKVASGEVWHDFVMYTVASGLGGLENLALIPGTVGAAPIQNIGAYGTEVAHVISNVGWYHLNDRDFVQTTGRDCLFGYRDSVFKSSLSKHAYITDVTFRLNKRPVVNTSYGAITEELSRLGKTPSIQSVAEAVINIRRSKLPDPAVTGNAGSFFKNPTVNSAVFGKLRNQFATMPFYELGNGSYKIPAGWLIEYCGWKGYISETGAGVHDKQALVLVNKLNATGDAILTLSSEIIASVTKTFDITLEREVQIW